MLFLSPNDRATNIFAIKINIVFKSCQFTTTGRGRMLYHKVKDVVSIDYVLACCGVDMLDSRR